MTDNEAAQIANYTELASLKVSNIYGDSHVLLTLTRKISTEKADIAYCKFIIRFIYSFLFFFCRALKPNEMRNMQNQSKFYSFFCHDKQSTKTKWFFRKNQ